MLGHNQSIGQLAIAEFIEVPTIVRVDGLTPYILHGCDSGNYELSGARTAAHSLHGAATAEYELEGR